MGVGKKITLQIGRIAGLDFVRALGAIGIVFFHFGCHCPTMAPYLLNTANGPWGNLWVALFFAVSGACVVRSNTTTGVTEFYRKRWMAIFPIFFLCYAFSFVLHVLGYGKWWAGISAATIPLTLLGVDSYFYYLQPNFAAIGEWFIGAILVCYLLFPLLRWLLQRIPWISLLVLIGGCFVIPFHPYLAIEPWRHIWTCATIFYIGMFLAQYPQVFTSRISMLMSGLVMTACVCIRLPFQDCQPLSLIIYPMLSGVSAFIFFSFAGKVLERQEYLGRFIAWMSRLSYPIFLLHHIVIMMFLDRYMPTSVLNSMTCLFGLLIAIVFISDMVVVYYNHLRCTRIVFL